MIENLGEEGKQKIEILKIRIGKGIVIDEIRENKKVLLKRNKVEELKKLGDM